MNVTDTLLDPILRAQAARPLITYYDQASGERIELSGTTAANWAAKTGNMVRDEFGLAPGDRVAVLLPAHWQTATVLLGAWWAGCEVLAGAAEDAQLAFTTADTLAGAGDAEEIAALSLDPFGRALPGLPVGVTDFATTVPGHGDQFQATPSSDAPALDGMTATSVLARGRAFAEEQGWDSSSRIISTRAWTDAGSIIEGFIAVLAAGASLIQVANADAAALGRISASEKATHRIG
ncbi:TIGR03089 family protein [Hoyosella sp. G463]|uniref:TIGR03089 family protein n=1 Tax=Lolliginicoccus lacisalsi TaxID=2742202 RepID=A0A927JCB6_9ACTN|nr:TIGR03089 family protein [Lolliginicoccus lacisalsi]MBD8506594.1 TIGR03089 family protein [Lolliginicoccus lacisalsi]